MVIARTVEELRAARAGLRDVGLVPTMGALHAGHRSLLVRARVESGGVVASIFVNPLQFAAGEDLEQYPRTFEADCAMLETEKVDVLFAPSVEVMYPAGGVTFVEVAGVSERLDGASRPGHFRGVATVVAKLFHLVEPTRAYFGQKDAAQLAVLRRMVTDLNFPLEVVACPTVREPDGLAMSSRNRYLSDKERRGALAVSRALGAVAERIGEGERRVALLVTAGLRALKDVRVDYFEVVDAGTLLPVAEARDGALVAVAAWVGKTRLIDNFLVGPDHP